MINFFISYTHSDEDWAAWIEWNLRSSGYSVVIQRSDFGPGVDFVKKIEQATEEAQRTIAVLSPDYQLSPYASVEWRVAFAKDPDGSKSLIIPVLVEKFDVTGLLSLRSYIDLSGKSQRAAANALNHAIEQLSILKTGDVQFGEPEPPFPRRGTPQPSMFEQRGDAEQRLVSVISLRVRTGLDPETDPMAVLNLNESLKKVIQPVVDDYDGRVMTQANLEFVLIFGAPPSHGDDATRAVLAALEIHSALERRPDRGTFIVRTGVATGHALIIKDFARPSYPLLVEGPVMEISVNHQAHAPENKILVDHVTQALTNNVITYESREVGYAPTDRLIEPLERSYAVELADRKREMRRLVETYERVSETANPEFVTIVGLAGIGKSRLLEELHTRLASNITYWQVARNYPYGDPALWPLSRLVKDYAAISDSDDSQVAEAKLRAVIRDLEANASEADWLLSHLLPLVGRTQNNWQPTDREEAFAAYRRILEEISWRGSTVLVFEDAHWADDALLDFIEQLPDTISDVQLLVIILARPELLHRRKTWLGGKHRVTTISLEPLSRADTEQLLSNLIIADRAMNEMSRPLSDTLRLLSADNRPTTEILISKVGGNPLFAEEYAKRLVEFDRQRKTSGEQNARSSLPLPFMRQSGLDLISLRIMIVPFCLTPSSADL